MLGSLLGRGFAPKCKSLINKVQERADVLKRKRQVVVGYLKQDIADLLRDGHDSHAFARVEGLIDEINRASCYEYIGKICSCLLQQLSSMQKQRDCPAECLEAVSGVMFAAARFADLPELCDIRSIFIEKYGSSLESHVNQKFVEKSASRPTSINQKLQLMHDISQEFSVGWNGKDFNQKTSDSLATHCNPPTNQRSAKYKDSSQGNKTEVAPQISNKLPPRLGYPAKKEVGTEKRNIYKQENSCNRISEFAKTEELDTNNSSIHCLRGEDDKFSSSGYRECAGNTGNRRALYNNVIPPPYVRPNKSEIKSVAEHVGPDEKEPTLKSADKKQNRHAYTDHDASGPGEGKGDESVDGLVTYRRPKHRSVREKHFGPSPTTEHHVNAQGGSMENVAGRSSRGGRRGKDVVSKDLYEDEEEAIMDRLLIHYSKKSVSYEAHRIRPGTIKAPNSNGEPRAGVAERLHLGPVPAPARTFSLPNKPVTEFEKVPTRAASFKPESSNRNHVHPKLPDYDELAAQFAALKRGDVK